MSDDTLSMILAAVTRLEGNQAEFRQELGAMQAEIATLRVDIMERLDQHENHLTSIRDDISIAMGGAEQVKRHSENTRDDLRALNSVVTAMQKQIMRLQSRVDALGL